MWSWSSSRSFRLYGRVRADSSDSNGSRNGNGNGNGNNRRVLAVAAVLALICSSATTVVSAELFAAPPSTYALSTVPSALFVCAEVNGTVYTLDAWTGAITRRFPTGRPLVSSSSRHVVPGLDGRIYFYDENQSVLEALLIDELMHRPVQTCVANQCGILTATKVTTLFGIQAWSGQVVWSSRAETSDEEDDCLLKQHVVLQREDFLVQHISTATGKELWNITFGHFSALNFDEPSTTGLLKYDNRQAFKETMPLLQSGDAPEMPDIILDEFGQTVTVVHQNNVLWKRQFPFVIASLYGIGDGRWVPLTVLDDFTTDKNDVQVASALPMLTGASLDGQNDVFHDLLWQQQPQYASVYGGVVLYRPTNIRPMCEENGVCIEAKISASPPKYIVSPQPPREPGFTPIAPPTLTQGGLFITWSMMCIMAIILVVIVYGLILWYEQKKKRWIMTPSLTPTAPTSSDIISPLLLENTSLNQNKTIKRSISMPVLNDGSGSGGHSSHFQSSLQQSDLTTHNEETTSRELPIRKQQQSQHQPHHSNIDGIPLVRYSRYKSEFKEIAALGRGGFGTVFSCENVLDGRAYAIKKILIKNYDDPQVTKEQLQRVLREVKILALLDHPNIVRYYTTWLELEDLAGTEEHAPEESCRTDSKLLTRCYSSEFLTSGVLGQQRPSHMGKPKKSIMANPLGWNNFLSEYSNASFQRNTIHGSLSSIDGFTFERSESNMSLKRNHSSLSSTGGILRTIHDSIHNNDNSQESFSFTGEETSTKENTTTILNEELTPKKSNQQLRHTLYIQMQLCSQKSLHDFLANPTARRRNELDENAIDLPFALSLFSQVAQGVDHVHKQGLIHRDLKPSNCFMDDLGVVKVGDFGLSRESTAAPDQLMEHSGHGLGGDEDNTAGVGTRSYASPEQMNGSDYDASTDVYSLGILLFELCYPMYTGMERMIVFSRIRNRDFPETWRSTVANIFPDLQIMLEAMLSPKPSDRPSAETVASHMKSFMSEFTVQSIDKYHSDRGATLLRVEAASNDEGILNRTIKLIKDVAPLVKIEQYGLRGGESSAIMEFALSTNDDKESLRAILSTMRATKEIKLVRQVSHSLHQVK